MQEATTARRQVPAKVRRLPLGKRIRWARESAGLSHDRLVAKIGRSNRGHLIKIEQETHTPRAALRHAIADATNVPRELFDDDDEEDDPVADLMTALLRRLVRDELSKERAPA